MASPLFRGPYRSVRFGAGSAPNWYRVCAVLRKKIITVYRANYVVIGIDAVF